MTTGEYRFPLGVECAWPQASIAPLAPPSAWARLLAFLRRAFV